VEINLDTLLKLYGPLGLIVFGLAVFVWKKLLPKIDQREAEYRAMMTSVVDDARKERDLSRQAREKEVDKFIESLKFRDQEFRSVANAISGKRSPRQK
jgi:F0F1-type ATP synthase membrane subunit b/b'